MKTLLQKYITDNSVKENCIRRVEKIIKEEAFIYETYDETDLTDSYKYLKDSFIRDYEFIKNNTNIKIEPYEKEGQPYKNSKEMFEDIDNGHFYYFKTENTRDSNNKNSVNKVMLEIYDNKPLNDIFRIVHDILGHYAFNHSFSQKGEIEAWYIHRSMMDKKGWAALWTETRGQNATFYYGEYKNIEISKRPFPEQRQVRPPDRFL